MALAATASVYWTTEPATSVAAAAPAGAVEAKAPPPPADQDPTKPGIQIEVPYYNEPEFLLLNESHRWNVRSRPAGTISSGFGHEDRASHESLLATARYPDATPVASATFGTLPAGQWDTDPLDVSYFDSDTKQGGDDGSTFIDRPYYVTRYQTGVIDIVGPADTNPGRRVVFAPPSPGVTYVGGAVESDDVDQGYFSALLVRSDGIVMRYQRVGNQVQFTQKFDLGQNAVAAVGRTVSHFARSARGWGDSTDPMQPNFAGYSESTAILLVLRADGQFIPIKYSAPDGATVLAPLSSQDAALRLTGTIGPSGNTVLDFDFSCQWQAADLTPNVASTGFVAQYLGCPPGNRTSNPDLDAAGRILVAVSTNGGPTVHAYTAGDYVGENTTNQHQIFRDTDAFDACNYGGTITPGSFDARVVSGVAYVGCLQPGNFATGMVATTYTYPSSLSMVQKIGWPARTRAVATESLGKYFRTSWDPMAQPDVGEDWQPKTPQEYVYDRWSSPVMQLQFPCAELLGRPARTGTALDDCDPSTGAPPGSTDTDGKLSIAPPPNWLSFTIADYASKGPGNYELAVTTVPIDQVPADRTIAAAGTTPPFGDNGYDRDNFVTGVAVSPYFADDLGALNAGEDVDPATFEKYTASTSTAQSPLFLAQVNRGNRTPVELTLNSADPVVETSPSVPVAIMQAPPSVLGLSQQDDFTPEFAVSAGGGTGTSSGTSSALGGHIEGEVVATFGVGAAGNHTRAGASVSTDVTWNNESESSVTKSVDLTRTEGYGGAFDDTAIVTRAFKEYVWGGVISYDPTGMSTGDAFDYRLPGEEIISSRKLGTLQRTAPGLYGPTGLFAKSVQRITNGYTVGAPSTYYQGASSAQPTSILEANGGPCIGGYTAGGIPTDLGVALPAPISPTNPYLERTIEAPTGPNVITSAQHHVSVGDQLTESATIEINSTTARSRLSTKSLDWGVTVSGKFEQEFDAGASAKLEITVGAGINGAYSSSSGIEDSLSEGSSIATTIGNIPFSADQVGSWIDQEQYDWRMYFCKARMGPQGLGQTVWVQGYVIGDYLGDDGVTELSDASAVSPAHSALTTGVEGGTMTGGAAQECPATPDPSLTEFRWSHPAGTMKRYALDLFDSTTGEDATYEVASWSDPADFNDHVQRDPDDDRVGIAPRVSCAAIPNTQFAAGHVLQWKLIAQGFTENEVTSPAAFFRPVGPGTPPTTVTLSNARTVREGGTATFKVRLDQVALTPTSVTVKTKAMSAKPGKDFAATTQVITFPVGTRTASVKVKTLRDKVKERTEAFALKVTKTPADLNVAGGTATGKIRNRGGR